jgi:hypothetical protein
VKTIWKVELPIGGHEIVPLPKGSKILTVQTQYEKLWFWALVDNEVKDYYEYHRFEIRGTGHDCTGLNVEEYFTSFQLKGGAFVGHVFYLGAT